MARYKNWLIVGIMLALSACASPKVDDYAGRQPELDIRQFLNGDIDAWGVFLNRSGMVDKQFHVAMHGAWQGNTGTLQEHFDYTDGTTDDRVWTITFNDDGHHFTATAHDVIGTAVGAQFGNAVNMNYILRVPVKDTSYDLSMDDWLYQLNKDTLINHVEMSKLGFKAGELFITFRKRS